MYDHNIFLPYLVYSNFKIYGLFIIMAYHLEKKSYAKKVFKDNSLDADFVSRIVLQIRL